MVDSGFFNDREGATRIGKLRVNWKLTEKQCCNLISYYVSENQWTDAQIHAASNKQLKEIMRSTLCQLGKRGMDALEGMFTFHAHPLVKRIVRSWS